jgi:hypothetical protein
MHNPSRNLKYRSFQELAPYRERLKKKGVRYEEQYVGEGAGAIAARRDDAEAE